MWFIAKVVQHGGNGETMIGSIDDLDLPIADGMGTKAGAKLAISLLQ